MVLLFVEPHQGLQSVSKHFFQFISKTIDLDVIRIEKFLKTASTLVILNVFEHSAITPGVFLNPFPLDVENLVTRLL